MPVRHVRRWVDGSLPIPLPEHRGLHAALAVPRHPLHELSVDARLVVCEPLGDLQGAWREIPESSSVMVHGGDDEVAPFAPVSPVA